MGNCTSKQSKSKSPTANLAIQSDDPIAEPTISSEIINQEKTIKLRVQNLIGSLNLEVSCTTKKFANELYEEVRTQHISEDDAKFVLFFHGRELLDDEKAIDSYGVTESGRIDCLFLPKQNS